MYYSISQGTIGDQKREEQVGRLFDMWIDYADDCVAEGKTPLAWVVWKQGK